MRGRAALGGLPIVELGCGSALFAKLLLDAFKLTCEEKGRDYYERLTYYATDRSPAAVAQWRERGVFAGHDGHVELLVLDANAALPANVAPRVVVCNYVLDVLPAAVLRRNEEGRIEQLCARTHLANAREIEKLPGEPSLADLRELVAHDTAEGRDTLLRYSPRFDLEVAFRPLAAAPPAFREACEDAAPLERVLVNHGALECLSNLVRSLDPHGFVAINDYGPTQRADVASHASCQQFGSTTAFGLNFPLLERALAKLGATCLAPPGDGSAPLHSRLVSRRPLPAQVECAFEQRFGGAARIAADRGLASAREHAAAGSLDPALVAYRECLEQTRATGRCLAKSPSS